MQHAACSMQHTAIGPKAIHTAPAPVEKEQELCRSRVQTTLDGQQ